MSPEGRFARPQKPINQHLVQTILKEMREKNSATLQELSSDVLDHPETLPTDPHDNPDTANK